MSNLNQQRPITVLRIKGFSLPSLGHSSSSLRQPIFFFFFLRGKDIGLQQNTLHKHTSLLLSYLSFFYSIPDCLPNYYHKIKFHKFLSIAVSPQYFLTSPAQVGCFLQKKYLYNIRFSRFMKCRKVITIP